MMFLPFDSFSKETVLMFVEDSSLKMFDEIFDVHDNS
jgi:hypothetical protein